MHMRKLVLIFFLLCKVYNAHAQFVDEEQPKVVTGAEQMDKYLPLLSGKKVALLINQTSVVGANLTLLPDTLLARNVKVTKILAPEHGFRGTAEAGVKVSDEKDAKTGLPVMSLYGNNKKTN